MKAQSNVTRHMAKVHSAKFLILLSLSGCSVGCSTGQGIFGVDRCADVPKGAIPGTAGHHLCQWQQAQVASAFADAGVFYQTDFIDKSDRLSPAAEKQVARLVQQGTVATVPLVLEPSEDPHRDEARRNMIANAFSAAGVPLSADQIRIAHPPALGLDGYRAQQVARAASRTGNRGGGVQGMGGGMGAGVGGGFSSGNGGMF